MHLNYHWYVDSFNFSSTFILDLSSYFFSPDSIYSFFPKIYSFCPQPHLLSSLSPATPHILHSFSLTIVVTHYPLKTKFFPHKIHLTLQHPVQAWQYFIPGLIHLFDCLDIPILCWFVFFIEHSSWVCLILTFFCYFL